MSVKIGNSSNDPISITGDSLSFDHVELVARHASKVELATAAFQKIEASAQQIASLADSEQPIYGVNTGFGVFSDQRIAKGHSAHISRNLILSHAVGIGSPFPKDVTRAALLIRANTLAKGYSGVRPQIIQGLLAMLNQGVTPVVPSQGSLGSSGDLAHLAHLVLVLADVTDEHNPDQSGAAHFRDQQLAGSDAMAAANIERVTLGPKEGLALTNGATFSAALAALALIDAERLLHASEVVAAMTFDALLGTPAALDPRIHEVRGHPGQIASARRILSYLSGSKLAGSTDRIQDAYSLRCTPQITGPAWEALGFSKAIIQREINAATDNPLIFESEVISGGNFHGHPIGLVADLMKIALTEVCNLSERRTYRMLAVHTNAGLPPMLIANPEMIGLHSGLMMLQYTAASLCLENQGLASPASIRSLPTSGGQEDHNANSATAARNLAEIITNMTAVVAIELLCAAQALEIRQRNQAVGKAGRLSQRALEAIRGVSTFIEFERPMAADIEAVSALLQSGALLEAVGIEAML